MKGWRLLQQRPVITFFRRHTCGVVWFIGIALTLTLAWFLPQFLGQNTAVSQFVESHEFFLASLLGSFGLLGLWFLLWKLPQHQAAEVVEIKDRLDLESKSRQTLAQIVGGAALLIGLYFTAQTLKVSREGQITDRFTKAVAQLGDPNLAIRVGGIYALERIAKDSAADYGAVMKMLTAFIREYSHRRPETFTKDLAPENQVETKPPADIQTILTIIGQRIRPFRDGETQSLDLRKAQLQGADFRQAQLQRADLSQTQLQTADFRQAQLQEAIFKQAQLQEAIFKQAQLQRADFSQAQLQGADFRQAQLQEAIFKQAQLQGADLWQAQLQGADLWQAQLEEINLGETQLQGADLRQARNLTQRQINVACVNEKTQLPDGLTKPPPCPTKP